MEAKLYNQKAEEIGTVELPDEIFSVPVNADLLYQVVISQEANQRRSLAHAKGRGDVRGGGIKPWRQKGTGRARHGSIRSPIWKGGGVTHGPTKDRNFKKKISKKMARKALAMAISSKVSDGEIAVIDAISLPSIKTKDAAATLKTMAGIFPNFLHTRVKTDTLLVTIPSGDDRSILRAMRNIPNIEVIEARNLNARTVLSRHYILLAKDAIKEIKAK